MLLAEYHLSYIMNYGAENRSSSGHRLIVSDRVTFEFLGTFGQQIDDET